MLLGTGETITINRRVIGEPDEWGNPTYTTETITVDHVLVAFGSTTEPIDASRSAVDAKMMLYLPMGTVIDDADVFVVRDKTWLKDGLAQEWNSPFGAGFGGVVLNLRVRNG
jgi:hypothetical protein